MHFFIYPILDWAYSSIVCVLQAEEKMRALYDRQREELKILDEKGAEADKLEATERSIRKLSTKISIAIQVVNTISDKISKLRDEELWPQTCELIQGYAVIPYGNFDFHMLAAHSKVISAVCILLFLAHDFLNLLSTVISMFSFCIAN